MDDRQSDATFAIRSSEDLPPRIPRAKKPKEIKDQITAQADFARDEIERQRQSDLDKNESAHLVQVPRETIG